MTYPETIEYLYKLLPVYQRVGAPAYKPGLDNIKKLCEALGNPQHKFPTVHIAGTNGKGSVSHYLASILQSAGYKNVGLHTSPHLKDFRERIRINGLPVSEGEVVGFVEGNKDLIEQFDCSFFELSVAMAFYFFAKAHSQIAVIETGMGGRLDSTNIITPVLSVITNISYDHVAILGNTLPLIASEKAGIIKPGVPVVIGESNRETMPVFLKKAIECKSPVFFADSIYHAGEPSYIYSDEKSFLKLNVVKDGNLYIQELHSELLGLYQQKNIQTVLCSVDRLSEWIPLGNEAGYPITIENIKHGIENVITQTGLMGRWQTLNKKPLTIADTAHNETGIRELLKQIEFTPHECLHFVIGVVQDKDPAPVLKLLPKDATYYFCKANIPRSLDENELMHKASEFGLKGKAYSTVQEAINAARINAAKNDLVIISGSTFVVAEAI